MRYCLARLEQARLDFMCRVYVTDALKAAAENTSRFAGGSYMKTRFAEIVEPKHEETRTAEEIISSILAGLKGEKS